LTLEELYKGGTKRLKITRRRKNGADEEKVLEIAYKAGWKKGTKIKFAGAGHEDEYGQGQTIVFVVEEKPHPRVKREDDDVVVSLDIPLLEALTGSSTPMKQVEQLDGRKINVPVPRGVSGRGPLVFFVVVPRRSFRGADKLLAVVFASNQPGHPSRPRNPHPRRRIPNHQSIIHQKGRRHGRPLERRLPGKDHPVTGRGSQEGSRLSGGLGRVFCWGDYPILWQK
jgi:hypothetical protein